MVKKHIEFNNILNKNVKDNIDSFRVLKHCDSRNTQIESNSIDLIITSPPYTISYEYADLHQLPSIWFGYFNELSTFRQNL
jgi:DNA modification methylase